MGTNRTVILVRSSRRAVTQQHSVCPPSSLCVHGAGEAGQGGRCKFNMKMESPPASTETRRQSSIEKEIERVNFWAPREEQRQPLGNLCVRALTTFSCNSTHVLPSVQCKKKKERKRNLYHFADVDATM